MAGDMSAPGPFSPYVKSITANDPLMQRVPFDVMDIGANSASLPSGKIAGQSHSIEHVGSKPTKA